MKKKLRPLLVVLPVVLAAYLLGTYLARLEVAARRTHRSACTSLGLTPFKARVTPAHVWLTMLDGTAYPLARLHGRLVGLNFWLTTCQPCLQEIPSLVDLARRYEGHGLAVLLVATDKEPGVVEPVVQKLLQTGALPSNVVLLHDRSGRLARRMGTRKFPETYLVSTTGDWLGRVVGDRDWNSRVATACVFPRLP